MDDFRKHLSKQMENPEFVKEWQAIQPEIEITRAMIKARAELGLTQKQLAEKTGIDQAHISRLENGNYNPSLDFLKRIAKGIGKELHIEFR